MSQRVSHGADAEALDDIAVALRRQGERIDDVGGRGSAQLEKLRAVWDGPDFEEFARRWRRAHRHVDEAAQSIRAYSKLLASESEDQRRSSGGPSGRGGDGGHRGAGGREGIRGGAAQAGPVEHGGRGGDHGQASFAQVVPAPGLTQWEPIGDIGRPTFELLEDVPPPSGEQGGELVSTGVVHDTIAWTGPGRPQADLLAWDPVEVTRWDWAVDAPQPTWLEVGGPTGPR